MIQRIKPYASTVLAFGVVLAVYGLFWTLIRGRLEPVGEATLIVGLVAIAAYVALESERVGAALSGRAARQGGNALVVVLAVAGIAILVNMLAARHHKRVDLTAERQFSLSKQSKQVLAGLAEPVAVTAFMTPNYYGREQVEDLLKEYTYHTDKLKVEYVDPEQKPAVARQYGITSDGVLVFQCGDRRQDTFGSDEQALTSAIVKVTRRQSKVAYFLTGHRERDPQDSAQAGYSQIAEALKRDNYQVETLNLAITPTVPSQAAVLIVASPQVTPTTEELSAINTYVDGGGSVLLLSDPASPVHFAELLGRFGLSVRRDIVIDPARGFFGDVATPLIDRFPYHTITKDLTGLSTFFPLACSIAKQEQLPQGVQVSPLVQTSAQSWGETDREARQVRLDQGKDTPGPLDLAVAATRDLQAETSEDQARKSRLVVMGDADLVANDVLTSVRGNLGNADLFLNAVNWLAEEEDLISIRPNPPAERTIFLQPAQVRLVMYTSIIFMPALVIVAGVWVWWKRR